MEVYSSKFLGEASQPRKVEKKRRKGKKNPKKG